jgi:hypothetical protein
MRTDGRLQNAAMIVMRQKPGQRGSGACGVVLGRLDRRRLALINDHKHKAILTKQALHLLHSHITEYHMLIIFPLTIRSRVFHFIIMTSSPGGECKTQLPV